MVVSLVKGTIIVTAMVGYIIQKANNAKTERLGVAHPLPQH